MMIKRLRIVNSLDKEFGMSDVDRLFEDIDFSGLSAYISATESSGNGSYYQGTKLEDRYFDIFMRIRKNNDDLWLQDHINKIFNILTPTANPMTLYFTTVDDFEYYINIVLTGAPSMPTVFSDNNKAFRKMVIPCRATDPLIYYSQATSTDIAEYSPTFEFALDIDTDYGGIEFGVRTPGQLVNVNNNSSETVGALFTFTANTTVVNPSILNTDTYEQIKILTTMEPGEIIEVNTIRGQRSVMRTRNGIKENIFYLLDFETSSFFPIYPGDNLLRYDASSGVTNLNVNISFRGARVGV